MDGNITLNEIGNLIFAQIKEESAKDFMSHVPLTENTIKFDLFNQKNLDDSVTITLRCYVNDIKIEVTDTVNFNETPIKEKYFVGGNLFLTSDVWKKFREEIDDVCLKIFIKLDKTE